MNLLWFIPTFGDGRYLGSVRGARETNFAYLRQIAEAVDTLGYDGALFPTGRTCDDSWIVANVATIRAVTVGLMSPGLTAIRNRILCVAGTSVAVSKPPQAARQRTRFFRFLAIRRILSG